MSGSSSSRRRLDVTHALFVTGVVVASLYAARPAPIAETTGGAPESPAVRLLGWVRVAGGPFALGVGLMALGAWLGRARRSRHFSTGSGQKEGTTAERTASDSSSHDPVALAARLLAHSAARLEKRRGVPQQQDTAVWRAALDELLEQDVPALLELGPALRLRLGAVRYAELMDACAGCERNAARAWSALTDGALDEVPPSLERAETSLALARSRLHREAGAGDGAGPGNEASSNLNRG